MWTEFKNFAFKGNAFDLAVGVIMGGAFGTIVTSVVNDLIMPIISVITGGVSFSNHFIPLSAAVNAPVYADAAKQGATFGYGNFIQVLVQFLILAFFVFLLVKASNTMKRNEVPAPPPPASTTETLLAEIRDGLRARK